MAKRVLLLARRGVSLSIIGARDLKRGIGRKLFENLLKKGLKNRGNSQAVSQKISFSALITLDTVDLSIILNLFYLNCERFFSCQLMLVSVPIFNINIYTSTFLWMFDFEIHARKKISNSKNLYAKKCRK